MIERNTTVDQKSAFEILKKVLQSERAEIRDIQEPAFIRAKHGYWHSPTPRNDPKILAINVVSLEQGSKVTITTSLSGETVGWLCASAILCMLMISVRGMPELILAGVLGIIITVVYGIWLVISIDKFASEIIRSLP